MRVVNAFFCCKDGDNVHRGQRNETTLLRVAERISVCVILKDEGCASRVESLLCAVSFHRNTLQGMSAILSMVKPFQEDWCCLSCHVPESCRCGDWVYP